MASKLFFFPLHPSQAKKLETKRKAHDDASKTDKKKKAKKP